MAMPVTFNELLKKLKETRADVVVVTKSGAEHVGKIQHIMAEYFQMELPDKGAGAPNVLIRTDAVDHFKAINIRGLEA